MYLQKRDELAKELSSMEKCHEETKVKLEGEIAELHEARSAVEQETQEKADTQQHTEVKLKVVYHIEILNTPIFECPFNIFCSKRIIYTHAHF